MSLLKQALYGILLPLLISCAADDSGYVDIPEDHGDQIIIKDGTSAPDVFTPGTYENALIALDENKISGVYNASNNCIYFFESEFSRHLEERPLKWRRAGSNESGEGLLISAKDTVTIHFKSNSKGCAPELFNTPHKIALSKANNWKDIRVVESKSINISSEPEDAMEIGQKFQKGDIICVLEAKKEWLRVEKIGKNTQAGWIKESDLKK